MQNYFELFGLPQSYEVDEDLLRARYRLLLSQVHPDRFAGTTSAERLATQYTSLINDGFKTLRSPTKRAAYLLAQYGVNIDFESNTIKNRAFLESQMDWHEKLMQARHDVKALKKLDQAIEQAFLNEVNHLTDLFTKNTFDALDQAKETVLQLKFLERLLDEVQSQLVKE